MIKAVLFDVDGVLIDSFKANLKFYQDLAKYAGYNPPTEEAYREMFHMTMKEVARLLIKDKSQDDQEVTRVWNMGRNKEVPYPDKLLTTPTGYKEVIKKLGRKYLLGIVTSRVRGGVFRLSQLSDLEDLFKVVVCYEDTDRHKPEPDPLLLACERLNLKPEEAVYIGDTNTDIKAARSAGMKVIVYTKDNLPEADASTDNFKEIPKLVELMR